MTLHVPSYSNSACCKFSRMQALRLSTVLAILLLASSSVHGFVPLNVQTRTAAVKNYNKPMLDVNNSNKHQQHDIIAQQKSTALHMMASGSGLENVIAGAIAGAVGIGVAFPLDAIKTQVQMLNMGQRLAAETNIEGYFSTTTTSRPPSMLDAMRVLWDREGLAGFFNGVQSMMVGQAIVKSMAFSTNSFAIHFLTTNPATKDVLPHSLMLFLAACFAGFVASFVVTPVERVSVIVQSQNKKYASEWDCLQAVIAKDGVVGVCTRGLGATFAREIPSDGIYFWMYGILMHSQFAPIFGSWGPLCFGALAGMCSWIPIYPVDVIKTEIQNTDNDSESASSSSSFIEVAKTLYDRDGVGVFFEGFDAKILRAMVHHAVTFAVFQQVIDHIHK